MPAYNYKKGLTAMLGCFFIWGFQPLYWYLCGGMDTFFLMASRIVWAAVCCVLLLWMQGKLPQLAAAFKDKQVLKREIPAAVFLFGDWIVYLWAVQNGRVLECSLGYYIQPLVVFAFGAVIFKEKISWRHFVIIAIVVVGIVLSTSGFGGVPYVTIALATMFAIYAAIKKSLTIDSIVSTTMEIIMMVPVAIVFVLCCRHGRQRHGQPDGGAAAAADGLRCGDGSSYAVLCHRCAEPAADDHRYLPVSQSHTGYLLRHDHGREPDEGKAGELLLYLGRRDFVYVEQHL